MRAPLRALEALHADSMRIFMLMYTHHDIKHHGRDSRGYLKAVLKPLGGKNMQNISFRRNV